MDISNEFKALMGCKLHFRTYDGEYEGIVKSVSFEKKQVTLEHVYSCSQNVCIGNTTFFYYEILTYKVLNTFNSDTEVRKNELYFDSKVTFSKNNCRTNISYKKPNAKLDTEQSVATEDSNFTEFVLKLPSDIQQLLPRDSVILDSIDLEFKFATSHISKQSVIGVSFHGHKISRIGKLIWICISTKYCVFLFDIQTLGRDAFDKGLKNILQSQNIVKVIHECRGPSDCLFHLFSTTLTNVFDTQVADFIVNKQRAGRNFELIHVTSLDKCLVNYLAVPEELLYINKNPLCCAEESICFSKRPIDNQHRKILIKDTLCLIILREKLIKLMLNPVYEGSDLYIKAVAESVEPASGTSVPSVIPSVIAHGLKIVALQKDFVKTSAISVGSESKHSSYQTNGSARNSPEKDTCKTNTYKSDCVLSQNILSVTHRQQCERKSESKYSINTNNQAIPDTLANDITQKCSVVNRKFIRYKIPDTEGLKKTLNKISCSEKFRDIAVAPSDDSDPKSNVNKPHSKRSIKNKPLIKVSEIDTKASGNSHSQNESRNMSERVSNITNSNVPDYSDTWAKLRLAVSPSHGVSESSDRNSKKSFKIVPSGMGC